jgi:hypothetical protein
MRLFCCCHTYPPDLGVVSCHDLYLVGTSVVCLIAQFLTGLDKIWSAPWQWILEQHDEYSGHWIYTSSTSDMSRRMSQKLLALELGDLLPHYVTLCQRTLIWKEIYKDKKNKSYICKWDIIPSMALNFNHKFLTCLYMGSKPQTPCKALSNMHNSRDRDFISCRPSRPFHPSRAYVSSNEA